MDTPERLKDGRLRVPMRAEADDGTIGDGMAVIGPDHPAYAAWDEHLPPADKDQRR